MLGRELEGLMQRAREYKKEYGDSFVSVEHLVLGFIQIYIFSRKSMKLYRISRLSVTLLSFTFVYLARKTNEPKYSLCNSYFPSKLPEAPNYRKEQKLDIGSKRDRRTVKEFLR